MKSTSLILNLVLLVAVVVIYILHFSSDKVEQEESVSLSNSVQQTDQKIAYLKVDSLIAYYDFALETKQRVCEKSGRL